MPKGIRIKKITETNCRQNRNEASTKKAVSESCSTVSLLETVAKYLEDTKSICKTVKKSGSELSSKPAITATKTSESNLQKIARSSDEETDADEVEEDCKSSMRKCQPSKFVKIKSTTYICVVCGVSFPSLDSLNDHMKSPTSCHEVSFSCPVCQKTFVNKSRCNAHLNTHKQKVRYPCDKCGKVGP